jgi:hypothetical protein
MSPKEFNSKMQLRRFNGCACHPGHDVSFGYPPGGARRAETVRHDNACWP